MANVVTVREAVQRAKQDGFPVSEYTLRRWIKIGAVPVRKTGTKLLIFYPNLVRYLQCTDGGDNQPTMVAAAQEIRRINL